MLLTDWCKATASPLLRLRRQSHLTPLDHASLEQACDVDLVSKDKTKQKEAVKRFLATRIRNDWTFTWPPPNKSAQPSAEKTTEEAAKDAVAAPPPATDASPATESAVEDIDDDIVDDGASEYSVVSEDLDNYRPRVEWLSDFSDEDEVISPSAYRFDSPEAVGTAIKACEASRSDRRRRSVRAEMEWNSGLACFNARRDAWTGAKTVRVRTKSPSKPPSESRRLSWWRLSGTNSIPDGASSSVPTSPTTQVSGDTTAVSSSDGDSRLDPLGHASPYPVEVLIPVPPPLLPPANPMRASITSSCYPAIYDKIVIHALTPACPINLGDMIKACVTGWKRDGEWPYRQPNPPQVAAVPRKKPENTPSHTMSNGVRRMSMSILGKKPSAPSAQHGKGESLSGPKGIRRSLQKVLGLGQERPEGHGSVGGQ